MHCRAPEKFSGDEIALERSAERPRRSSWKFK
jgi:hypothetical protein